MEQYNKQQKTEDTAREKLAGAPEQTPRQGRYHFLLETGESMDETRLGAFLKKRAGKGEEENSNP